MDNEVHTGKPHEEMSLIDVAAILLRHRAMILVGTAAAALGGVLFAVGSLVLPPERSYLPNFYVPKAVVLVSEDSGSGLAGLLAASGLGSRTSLPGVPTGGYSKAELAILLAKSNTAIDELNEEFDFTSRYKVDRNPRSGTRRAFLARFSAALDQKTGTVALAFKDTDPEYAARVVNRSVDILDRRFAALSGKKASEQKRLLEGKLADVQVAIDRIEAEIAVFTSKYGYLSVDALATEQVTVLARLRSELIMKDMEIENYTEFSKVDDPVIRRLRTERASIASKIAELESGRSAVLPGGKDITSITFELSALQRELLVQGEIYKLLNQQYELARLDAEGSGPSFQVVELAEAPDQKAGPSRGMLCAAVTLAAFFLLVLTAFVLEAIHSIRNDPHAMSRLRGGDRS
ncbi:MAG: hypothetical protein JXA15_09520 [Spirochaetales bacterium]|nr:hypothetical protein [Spirochaetales bacterium]